MIQRIGLSREQLRALRESALRRAAEAKQRGLNLEADRLDAQAIEYSETLKNMPAENKPDKPNLFRTE